MISRFFPRIALLLLAVALVQGLSTDAWAAAEVESQEQICDPLADYFLGMEDYKEAIRLHQKVIQQHPDNALAHYHLGFAYGMLGQHRDELREYREAIDLGLSDWALFLNLGMLYLENERLEAATDILELATLLGPDRPETHFNLGLAYERRGRLAKAEQQFLLSLRLDPGQAEARNMLGVIYAEQGDYARAREEWRELSRAQPSYEPARTNLAALERLEHSDSKSAQHVDLLHTP
ncbi:MAG TPA: tetratricopeptide repeat protein [Candidatus Binataceae bacterium]|nr:tetratricopeptide repeat protein [Candidatus Binataceae bacterium]